MDLHQFVNYALDSGRTALTEAESKTILGNYGVPVVAETIAATSADAVVAAADLGFPVVLKGIGEGLLHKTESGLVHLNLADEKSVSRARQRQFFRPHRGRKFSFNLKFVGIENSWPVSSVTPILVRRFYSD